MEEVCEVQDSVSLMRVAALPRTAGGRAAENGRESGFLSGGIREAGRGDEMFKRNGQH